MTAVEWTSGPPDYTLTYQQPGPVDGVALEFDGSDAASPTPSAPTPTTTSPAADAAELYGSDGFTVELWFWAALPAIAKPNFSAPTTTAASSPTASTLTHKWQLYLDPDGELLRRRRRRRLRRQHQRPRPRARGNPGRPRNVGAYRRHLRRHHRPSVRRRRPRRLRHRLAHDARHPHASSSAGNRRPPRAYSPLLRRPRSPTSRSTPTRSTAGTIDSHADTSTAGTGSGSEFQMLESDGAGGIRWAYPSFEVDY